MKPGGRESQNLLSAAAGAVLGKDGALGDALGKDLAPVIAPAVSGTVTGILDANAQGKNAAAGARTGAQSAFSGAATAVLIGSGSGKTTDTSSGGKLGTATPANSKENQPAAGGNTPQDGTGSGKNPVTPSDDSKTGSN
jgi:hypothetical protein